MHYGLDDTSVLAATVTASGSWSGSTTVSLGDIALGAVGGKESGERLGQERLQFLDVALRVADDSERVDAHPRPQPCAGSDDGAGVN